MGRPAAGVAVNTRAAPLTTTLALVGAMATLGTVSVAGLLTARPDAWVTVQTMAYAGPASASAAVAVYVYVGELVPTTMPPLVHVYATPVVADAAVSATVKVAVAGANAVALAGWEAIATLLSTMIWLLP
jgi:hypothetical protein